MAADGSLAESSTEVRWEGGGGSPATAWAAARGGGSRSHPSKYERSVFNEQRSVLQRSLHSENLARKPEGSLTASPSTFM